MNYVNEPTKEEIKIAKKIAFSFLYSFSNLRMGKRFDYDGRTRIGNLAAKFVKENYITTDRAREIRAKQKKRREQKENNDTLNWQTSKIYKDYSRNSPTGVYANRLIFGSRNHWGKNKTDLKILSILQKHFLKRLIKNKDRQTEKI